MTLVLDRIEVVWAIPAVEELAEGIMAHLTLVMLVTTETGTQEGAVALRAVTAGWRRTDGVIETETGIGIHPGKGEADRLFEGTTDISRSVDTNHIVSVCSTIFAVVNAGVKFCFENGRSVKKKCYY